MPILRPGEVHREAILKDGRTAIIRAPRWEDLDDLVAFINELVEERAEIVRTEKVSREDETDWLGMRLAASEKCSTIALVAVIDGRRGEVSPQRAERQIST